MQKLFSLVLDVLSCTALLTAGVASTDLVKWALLDPDSGFWGENSLVLRGSGLARGLEPLIVLLGVSVGAYLLARHEERIEQP